MSCDYITEKFLGAGTYGTVLAVEDKNTKKKYAIKLSKETVFLTLKEIDVLFRILSPEIIKGISLLGKDSECEFMNIDNENEKYPLGIVENIVSGDVDLKDGQNIFQFLNIPDNQILILVNRLIENISSGLNCLAIKNYYHIDIKPQNIFYEKSGPSADDVKFYIGDYGLCYPVENQFETVDIGKSHFMSTLFYLSPEMLVGIKEGIKKIYYSSLSWQAAIVILEVVSGLHISDYLGRPSKQIKISPQNKSKLIERLKKYNSQESISYDFDFFNNLVNYGNKIFENLDQNILEEIVSFYFESVEMFIQDAILTFRELKEKYRRSNSTLGMSLFGKDLKEFEIIENTLLEMLEFDPELRLTLNDVMDRFGYTINCRSNENKFYPPLENDEKEIVENLLPLFRDSVYLIMLELDKEYQLEYSEAVELALCYIFRLIAFDDKLTTYDETKKIKTMDPNTPEYQEMMSQHKYGLKLRDFSLDSKEKEKILQNCFVTALIFYQSEFVSYFEKKDFVDENMTLELIKELQGVLFTNLFTKERNLVNRGSITRSIFGEKLDVSIPFNKYNELVENLKSETK